MKKLTSMVLVAILVLMVGITAVYAATDFKVVLKSDTATVEKGKEVVVTLSLKDFTAGETGINVLNATLVYDKTVFETVAQTDIKGVSGWSAPVYNAGTNELLTDNSAFIAEDHDAIKVTLKVKETAKVGNTVVEFIDIAGSNTEFEILPDAQKITLTVKEPATSEPDKKPDTNTTKPQTNTNTNTNTATKNPDTGFEDFTIPAILTIAALGFVAYSRYTRIEK